MLTRIYVGGSAAVVLTLLLANLLAMNTPALAQKTPAPIRVGMIGLDAHALPWVEIIHGAEVKPPISGMRIVAAVPTPSEDVVGSSETTAKTVRHFREIRIEMLDSIEEMLPKVDAVMILSIDGRQHPEQAALVFAAKKPLFIDKPVAASLAHVIRIYRQAHASGTPCFSNSALRYGPITGAAVSDPKLGRVVGGEAFSSSKSILPGHPDLFYYGIHGCETLFRIMGEGCVTVQRVKTESADLAVGVWKDGRLGSFRGILQGQVGYGATIYGEKGIASAGRFEGYEPLLAEIATFFRTHQPPVTAEQTIEIYTFMEAADESLRRNGQPIRLQEVRERAER